MSMFFLSLNAKFDSWMQSNNMSDNQRKGKVRQSFLGVNTREISSSNKEKNLSRKDKLNYLLPTVQRNQSKISINDKTNMFHCLKHK